MYEPGNAGATLCGLLDGIDDVIDATVVGCSETFSGSQTYSLSVTLDNGRELSIDVSG
jgi:hypothetical protein